VPIGLFGPLYQLILAEDISRHDPCPRVVAILTQHFVSESDYGFYRFASLAEGSSEHPINRRILNSELDRSLIGDVA
jgi:hypothetical protein